MSIQMMTKVFKDENLTPNKKLVMLALCDNSNDEGICYPSIDTIQSKTSLSRPTVIKIIAELEAEKYLLSYQRSTANNGRKSKVYLVFPLENYENLDSDWKQKLAQSKGVELYPQSKEALPKNAPQSKEALPKPLDTLYNHHIYLTLSKEEKQAYLDYVSMRKTLKLVTTMSIHNRLLNKYVELGSDIQVLIQATLKNWRDLFQVNKPSNQISYANVTKATRVDIEAGYL